jgi:very-short-patch-repair endonuclease
MTNLEQKVISMYDDQDMSTYQIAKELETYPNKIRRILIKHGRELKSKSAAQKVALKTGRSKHPTEGRERSHGERLNISRSMSSYWGEMDESDKQARVEDSKVRWANMTPDKRKEMQALAIEGIRRASTEGSKIENFVVKTVSNGGYRVQFHKKDLIPNQNLEIDLYIPSVKTIIEVDGPSHFLPVWGDDRLRKQMKADLDKNGLILSKGFVMIRIKALKTRLSLVDEEDLKNLVLKHLSDIETNFPPESERYIEVEL